MSIEKVREYFKTKGIDGRIQEFENSNATVPLAAKALHCKESRIAKMLSFDEAELPTSLPALRIMRLAFIYPINTNFSL